MEKDLDSTAPSERSGRGPASKIEESERRFRMIAEAVSDVVFTRDMDGVVDWVSPSVTTVLGWRREDFVGVSLSDVTHPDDVAAIEFVPDVVNELDAERGRGDVRFATADGGWRWMSALLIAISDDQGRVIGAVETLRDIHSEVEARQKLERSVRDLRSAQQMVGLAGWTWEPATDRVVWSKKLFEMFGLDPAGPPPDFGEQTNLYAAQSLAELNAAVAEAVSAGVGYDLQVEFVRLDSSRGWMRSWGEPVLDDHGVVVEVRGYAQDITAQVEAHRTLERQARDLIEAQQMARLGSWKLDVVTQEVTTSPEVREMFGWDPTVEVVAFDTLTAMLTPESFARLEGALAGTVRTGSSHELELEFVRADSGRGWMRSRGLVIRDDHGVVVEVRGYAQDITEQVEARRALERSDEMLQATQRMARLGSWEWNIATDQVVWSDEMFELFGLDPEEPAPAFADQVRLYAPESWDRVVAAAGKTAATGAAYEAMELEVVRADSSRGWVEVQGSAIRDDQGVIVALRGYVLDITDVVEAREELERNARDLGEVQQLARLGSWKLDVATQEVVSSPVVRAMYGWDPENDSPDFGEHAGMLTPESAVRLNEALAETVGTGGSYELELEVARADSSRGWMLGRGMAVLDDHGVVVEVRGYAQDITDQVEARRALERSDEMLQATQRMARLGSWEWNIVTDELVWSDGMFELFGLDPEEPPPAFADQVHLYAPESWERVVASAQATATTGVAYATEFEIIRADSSRGWVQVQGTAIRDKADAIVGLRGYLLDVTARKEAELALASSESLFRSAMLDSPIGMALSELDGSFRVVNDALCELLGRHQSWLMEHTIEDVTYPDDVDRLQRQREAAIEGELVADRDPVRLVRSDNQVLWVKRVVELIDGVPGNPDYLLVQYVDTTAEHEAAEELSYQASHDLLTGLHNWQQTITGLEEDLRAASESGQPVGVLFVDLDHFKVVNDSLGHAAGDEVLMTVAERIAGAVPFRERVGRAGGDEFIVVLPNLVDTNRVERVAEQIVSAVATDMMIRGHRIVPTVSIGVAVSVSDSTSSSLLRDADAALFRAKAAGRSRWQMFDDDMHTKALERLTIEDEIRRGLGDAEFVVHYQPIVTLADRQVAGHEALVRWEHPTRGLLSPFHFLPTAEDSGLIVGIGQLVLEQVCALLAASPDLPGPISVNFSPVQLSQADWFQAFSDTLARYAVDPRRIIVEVTETAVMSLLPGTREDLVALRDLGVGIHVDDFGTGFSSISLLRDMPVTGLKLDASFVADLSEGEVAANALSTGLAGLVSGLHLMGVAEGVESEGQHRVLLGQGWSHAQGYLYGRPAPQPVLTALTSVG